MSGPAPVRYRAAVAYVGTGFRGFQYQENAARTVQAVIERALGTFSSASSPSSAFSARFRVHAAGRTDAGVHADGQVIHFDLPSERDPRRIRDGVNSLLPVDVRILAVARAPEGFLSRRDAVWKEYLYRWSRAEVIPPRDSPFVAPIARSAEARPMRRAAALLGGRHDFSAFGVRRRRGESGVRRLHFVRIEERGDEIRALFRGDAFLRGMVRSISGVLAHVARGKAPEDRTARLLEDKDPRMLAPKAPAHGLTLTRVAYARDPFGVTPDVE